MAATVTQLPTSGAFTISPTSPMCEATGQFLVAALGGGTTSLNTGAANLATATVAVDTTAGGTAIAAARATRRSVTVRNLDGATSIYVGAGTITSANFLLKAGESINLDTVAAVKALSASGSVNVGIIETYD